MQTVAYKMPDWVWLWGPLALLLFILVVIIFFPAQIRLMLNAEGGVVELATPLLCVIAVIAGLFCLKHLQLLPTNWLMAWLILVIVSSFYFGGEEISWGQHLYYWETPEYMKEINDQKETNIHNISSWFDQKPRIVLELWVLIGGIFVPLMMYFRKTVYSREEWRYWFWPGLTCIPTAVIAIVIKLPERYRDLGGELPYNLSLRYSEYQEMFFAYFLMIYLLATYEKLAAIGKQVKLNKINRA